MDTQTWDALAASMRNAYTAGLGEGAVPRPVIMPLVRGELVGLIWLRPVETGKDALTGIAQLSNIAAAAGADEVVLAWETQDVAAACELPVTEPAPCLNLVHATKDGHTLHRFPYAERAPEGRATIEPQWLPVPEPQPDGELLPPVRAAVDYSFVPLDIDHPSPFGVTVVLMEEDGYHVRLTEAFAL
ncbi:hypothetical protein GCM10023084_68360 [Streptomyces lacrimifluminis]|uniref:Uncharacterized protein n=1 Tax=Streptomyces lacrimifluminis TaxID=1500077 RepID=A0A917UIQ5_9ACTN|nr:hypothetical protein [Streptomyces lacrimifluminis]GGJ61162.1 hypothetical protein GCM10012282_68050 [Streptomyces lacrimifluminis]